MPPDLISDHLQFLHTILNLFPEHLVLDPTLIFPSSSLAHCNPLNSNLFNHKTSVHLQPLYMSISSLSLMIQFQKMLYCHFSLDSFTFQMYCRTLTTLTQGTIIPLELKPAVSHPRLSFSAKIRENLLHQIRMDTEIAWVFATSLVSSSIKNTRSHSCLAVSLPAKASKVFFTGTEAKQCFLLFGTLNCCIVKTSTLPFWDAKCFLVPSNLQNHFQAFFASDYKRS